MDLLATRSVQVHARGKSISHLIKFSIESPEIFSDSDLENIVDVWKRKIEE